MSAIGALGDSENSASSVFDLQHIGWSKAEDAQFSESPGASIALKRTQNRSSTALLYYYTLLDSRSDSLLLGRSSLATATATRGGRSETDDTTAVAVAMAVAMTTAVALAVAMATAVGGSRAE